MKKTVKRRTFLAACCAAVLFAAAFLVLLVRGRPAGNPPDAADPLPYDYNVGEAAGSGSTDVGDVSWLTPTVQCNTVCFAADAPGHSWQNVSCGKTSIGHKGLLLAAKVLCRSAIDLYEDHTIIERAKAEFEEKTKGGFLSPVPADAVLRPLED